MKDWQMWNKTTQPTRGWGNEDIYTINQYRVMQNWHLTHANNNNNNNNNIHICIAPYGRNFRVATYLATASTYDSALKADTVDPHQCLYYLLL